MSQPNAPSIATVSVVIDGVPVTATDVQISLTTQSGSGAPMTDQAANQVLHDVMAGRRRVQVPAGTRQAAQ